MRSFLIKLTFFLLPVIAVLIYVEYALYKIPNTYNQKRKYLESQLKNIEVLTLGTSHMLHGINPAYLSEPAFNLANISQPLYYDKRLALKYVDSMPRLKLVIIDLAYFSFYYQMRQSPTENWRDYLYYRVWDIAYKDLPFLDIKRYSYIALYTPHLVREYSKHLFKINLADSLLSNGYKIPSPKASASFLNDSFARSKISSWNEWIDTSNYTYILNDLKGFILDLKKRNIAVALISSPILPALSKYYDPRIIIKNKAGISELCTECGCKYYDYANDNRISVSDFNDIDHLNYTGAARFSKIIDTEVVRTYIR